MKTPIDQEQRIRLLREIAQHLKSNDPGAIEALVGQFGMDTVFSEISVNTARAMRKPFLVEFLLTIARENNIRFDNLAYWHDVYHSINNKKTRDSTLDDTTKLALNFITHDTASSENLVNSLSKSPDINCLELLIDFGKWGPIKDITKKLHTGKNSTPLWLDYIKSLAHRQRFQQNKDEFQSISEVYDLIIHKIGDIKEISRTLEVTKILHAESLQLSGNYQAAFAAYEALDVKNNNIGFTLEKARCKCKIGDYPGAITHLDTLIDLLIRADSEKKHVAPLLKNPTDLNYTKADAAQAFSDLATLTMCADIPLFMVSGTLLGYCRNKDFLPHDKDLDFGIIGTHKLPGLIELALGSGQFTINPSYLKEQDTIQIPLVHQATGIWIDVFVYHEKNDHFITGVDFQFGYRQTFKFSRFNLKQVNFHGLTTYIPEDFDKNLQENFGNWMVPDANYLSHLESPSVVNFGRDSHKITSRILTIKALQDKSSIKLLKICHVLSQFDSPDDLALHKTLVEYLKRHKDFLPDRSEASKQIVALIPESA